MPKTKRTRRSKAQKTDQAVEEKPTIQRSEHFFSMKNYLILGFGLIVLIAGFYCLAQPASDQTKPAAEGFLSLNVAPVLLLLAYLVIIPVGILLTKKNKVSEE